MYNSNANGTHSYSTPASPNPYSTSSHHNADGKFAYDKDLAALFRATAANVTQLYKEASEIGNNAFKAGYEQCYNDICEFIASEQQDVGIQSADARRVLMERLMDFARLKRLAQRQATAGAASPSGSTCFGYPSTRPASAADYSQSHVEQSRHTIGTQGSCSPF
ncbi:hypothetical protein GGI26_005126 [Coemansia sp. RSA 1358]|nr:hypothetical protein BX070DRAFT_218717 [Coemansia spiralis]KAJ2620302.1 hypothetical protein GGI26_005126 [Coemansia sp. RSA 1358]